MKGDANLCTCICKFLGIFVCMCVNIYIHTYITHVCEDIDEIYVCIHAYIQYMYV